MLKVKIFTLYPDLFPGLFDFSLYKKAREKKIWDLNIFAEYSNDDRGSNSTDIFQNDLFLGSRINLNDVDGTEINQALTIDLDGDGNTGSFEISTRVNDSIRIAADYNFYWSLKSTDTLYSFRRDNYLGIKITNYF